MTTILVIDDSATSRALFRACALAEGDFDIHEAENYETALVKAQELKPDLCVVDYNLPDKVGTEIAQAIMDVGVETKFVLMTANTQKSVLEEADMLDFFGVIEKPIRAEIVHKILGEVL